MRSLLTLFFLVLATVTLCNGYANPLPCSGTCGNTHDPTAIRRASDGRFYRFATGGRIPIFSATSIQGPWQQLGTVLNGNAKVNSPGANDAWAPDVHLVGNTYVLFYACSQFGSPASVIGYATSSTLDPGSWTDHGQVIASTTSSGFNAIDANLVNPTTLGFGSFFGGLYQVPIGSNYQPTGSAYRVAYNSTSGSGDSVEGMYTFQYGGYWYMTFSSGQCCNIPAKKPPAGGEYKIMMCRSQSATGPFVDRNGRSCTSAGGSVLLESHGNIYGPGGQGVLQVGNTWYLYYHYMDTNVGLGDGQVLWGVNIMNWGSDGWPTV
ncbi:MAG: hypothetical protein Q9162_004693 [Coniocarpon cinnabarinum]